MASPLKKSYAARSLGCVHTQRFVGAGVCRTSFLCTATLPLKWGVHGVKTRSRDLHGYYKKIEVELG